MSEQAMPDPVELFERATRHAEAVMARVTPDQLAGSTPCSAWSVQDLIDHMVGGTDYLLSALAGRQSHTPRAGTFVDDYRAGVARALAGLREPGALERTCLSPLSFEWSVGQATAGTSMDQLIHTWDLATATGQDPGPDPELVEACSAMFLTERLYRSLRLAVPFASGRLSLRQPRTGGRGCSKRPWHSSHRSRP